VRRRLVDAFAQYDVAARRIRDLPADSPMQQRLQKAVYQQAATFLHLHMLPLKSLPKALKRASPNGVAGANGVVDNSRRQQQQQQQQRPVASARRNGNARALTAAADTDSTSRGSSGSISNSSASLSGTATMMSDSTSSTGTASTSLAAMEAEERNLRERLMVLEEQRFLVTDMLATARAQRRFDEVTALTGNVKELAREIELIDARLAQLDFAGAYQAQKG
jgi:hypothetical protein